MLTTAEVLQHQIDAIDAEVNRLSDERTLLVATHNALTTEVIKRVVPDRLVSVRYPRANGQWSQPYSFINDTPHAYWPPTMEEVWSFGNVVTALVEARPFYGELLGDRDAPQPDEPLSGIIYS